MPSRFARLLIVAMILPFAMGHGHGCGGGDDSVLGPPTETACPPAGTTLSYESFGRQFMTSYCTRCHSSTLTGAARMGATAYHDFDTIEGIRAVINHIDETAGAGPAATNQAMPPNGTKPTLEERQKLAEWLACAAP